jgi:hypothetical protein
MKLVDRVDEMGELYERENLIEFEDIAEEITWVIEEDLRNLTNFQQYLSD